LCEHKRHVKEDENSNSVLDDTVDKKNGKESEEVDEIHVLT
jgi:hypothetical protein